MVLDKNIYFSFLKIKYKYDYQYIISILNNEADFPYVFFKGESLSYYAYGEPWKRHFGDIDMLINRKDVSKMESLLARHGFVSKHLTREEKIFINAFSHQTPPLRKKTKRGMIEIDLNFDILWGDWRGMRPNLESFFERRERIRMFDVTVPTLNPQDYFLALCLHHYKDMNNIYHLSDHNTIITEKFLDISNFWIRQKNRIDIDETRKWMDKYELTPFFFYIFTLTCEIFDLPDLKSWAEELKTEGGKTLLSKYGLNASERKVWSIGFLERLDNPDLPSIVNADLTERDKKMLEVNRKIFG